MGYSYRLDAGTNDYSLRSKEFNDCHERCFRMHVVDFVM